MSKPRQVQIPIRGAKPADPNVVSRICGLADSGEIEKAADEVSEMFSRGMYDVSPFWIWLASRFSNGGPAELPKLLGEAARQLAADEALRDAALPEWGPAFAWFVDNARSRVRFHAKFHDQTWTRWCSNLTVSLEQELEAASGELMAVAGVTLRDELATGVYELAALVRRSFGGLIPAAPAPNVEGERGPSSGAGQEEDSAHDLEVHDPEAHDLDRCAAAASAYGEDFENVLAGSPAAESAFVGSSLEREPVSPASVRAPSVEPQRSRALKALQAKLHAFERLAGEQSWPLAAMVARDIERELSQFDPVRYFPDYFSNYLSTLCEVGSELELHMQPADSLEAQATERLYHADPERFLALLDAGRHRMP